jgi:hypothetical protein
MTMTTKTLVILVLLAAACDGGSTVTGGDAAAHDAKLCFEDLSRAVGIHCANYDHCKPVSFHGLYYDADDCASSTVAAMSDVVYRADRPALCHQAILDHYDCIAEWGCDIFGTVQEQTESGALHACLVESVGMGISCEATE